MRSMQGSSLKEWDGYEYYENEYTTEQDRQRAITRLKHEGWQDFELAEQPSFQSGLLPFWCRLKCRRKAKEMYSSMRRELERREALKAAAE